MPFANVSEFFTLLIALNVAVFGALTITLVILLVVLRSRNAARRRREDAVVAAWRSIFKTAYTGDARPTALPTIEDRDWFTVLALFTQFHQLRDGDLGREAEVFPKLDSLAAEAGIGAHALHFIDVGDDAERLLAFRVAGDLRYRDALPYALKYSSNESPELSRAAAECALRIEPNHLLSVLQLVRDRDDWVRSRVEAMLRDVPAGVLDTAMASAVSGARDDGMRRLLDYVRFCSPDAARSICKLVLERSSDAETIAASLRSLAPLANVEDRPTALRYCEHPSSIVQLSALRVLRKCVRQEDRPLLERMTANHDYWVRMRAAEAVVALYGDDGLARSFAEEQHDRFARDAVRQAIAERKAFARRTVPPDRRGQRRTVPEM